MLEVFCDAHTHLLPDFSSLPQDKKGYCAMCCAINKKEWEEQNALLAATGKLNSQNGNYKILRSFGVHPLYPDMEGISFFETLLKQGLINGAGEAGFDFRNSTPRLDSSKLKGAKGGRAYEREQEAIWRNLAELAIKYKKPLIIHCVKAIDKIFADDKLLSKAWSVVFHSFSGSAQEAFSLLNHGINAYFSFGKSIIYGGKRAAQCIKLIPIERLLLETDNSSAAEASARKTKTKQSQIKIAPALDIKRVYQAASSIREMALDELCHEVKTNFDNAYLMPR